ncbi:MAG: preprotein translocase subunit YajC [Mariprofundus sp.]|nr:preprotein translocase subunit YajC [Mariprofundus sp.]
MKTRYSSIIASVAAAIAIITPVYAEAAPAADGGSGFASLIPLVLIMVIFYFLLIRPQQKKLKEHRNLIDQLKKGDTIITGGGLYGKVTDVKDDTLKVDIADGVRVKVKRDTIVGLAD